MASKSTMVELVTELEKLKQCPEVEFMIHEARAGEYHDYKNQKYDCGKVEVVGKLHNYAHRIRFSDPEESLKALAIRTQVINGDYDEEADEEDKIMLAGLIRELAEGAGRSK